MKSARTKRKILLIDDNNDDCLLFERALNYAETENSVSMIATRNVTEAHNEINSDSRLPDVIFIDYNLRDLDDPLACLHFIVEMKSNDWTNWIPIVVFTDQLNPDDTIIEVMRGGASSFVSKNSDSREVFYIDIISAVNYWVDFNLTPHNGL